MNDKGAQRHPGRPLFHVPAVPPAAGPVDRLRAAALLLAGLVPAFVASPERCRHPAPGPRRTGPERS